MKTGITVIVKIGITVLEPVNLLYVSHIMRVTLFTFRVHLCK